MTRLAQTSLIGKRFRKRKRRSPRSAGHLVQSRHWRVLAIHLTWTVLALQGAVLLTLAMTPNKTPPDGRLFELLWASARKPQFYPLIALILFAPLLTVAAASVRGTHRLLLGFGWATFSVTAIYFFHERLAVMIEVLLWYARREFG